MIWQLVGCSVSIATNSKASDSREARTILLADSYRHVAECRRTRAIAEKVCGKQFL